MPKTMKWLLFGLCVLFLMQPLRAQQPTVAELRQALIESEQDLDSCRTLVRSLTTALDSTNQMIGRYRYVGDSLFSTLNAQISVQNQMIGLLETNSDTLQAMVNDYQAKLDEVSDLYIKELRRQQRSWIMTWPGIKGFTTGLFIGGALGLVFGIAN